MGAGRINENILNEIHNKCKNDKIMDSFLMELIYKEIESSGGLWKDIYKNLIESYYEKWGDRGEN